MWRQRKWGVLAALYQSTGPCNSATLPLLVKFDVQILLFLRNILNINPEKDNMRNPVTVTVSATTIATIAAIANDVGSQPWQ